MTVFTGVTLDAPRKMAISTLALSNGSQAAYSPVNGLGGSQQLSQRKRLLKAPTLAELDSSDSDVSVCVCVCVGGVFAGIGFC